MRSVGIERLITPPGSTLSSVRPASGPSCPWKYHHGSPFWAGTTTAPGRRRSPIAGASSGRLWAFRPITITSASASASMSAVAAGWLVKSPRGLCTRTPCSIIARRCGPRAISVTSLPACASAAPR